MEPAIGGFVVWEKRVAALQRRGERISADKPSKALFVQKHKRRKRCFFVKETLKKDRVILHAKGRTGRRMERMGRRKGKAEKRKAGSNQRQSKKGKRDKAKREKEAKQKAKLERQSR